MSLTGAPNTGGLSLETTDEAEDRIMAMKSNPSDSLGSQLLSLKKDPNVNTEEVSRVEEQADEKYIIKTNTEQPQKKETKLDLNEDGFENGVDSFNETQKNALDNFYRSYSSTGVDYSYENARKDLANSDVEIMHSIRNRLVDEIDGVNATQPGTPTDSSKFNDVLSRLKMIRSAFPGFVLNKEVTNYDGQNVIRTIKV
jgi:hypothetical protein